MKLWNEFCSRDEIEQRRILNGTSKLTKTPDTPTTSTGATGATTAKSPSEKSLAKKVQKRSSPYAASACFDRIDLKCRIMLCSKKVNWTYRKIFEKMQDTCEKKTDVIGKIRISFAKADQLHPKRREFAFFLFEKGARSRFKKRYVISVGMVITH
ncbi:hypothetical protein CAEBREN_16047 [Caenorhabditis brenneri]|uniref:R3H-associated N-terminal domain-containing protein n=1 Tax=Caenorhabditis brenneri TaxID=135651 RepID=G0PA10_CAEBE|nr:hypothetical protein CAEBREN_16047 [Caenorhabditis brenneri]